MKDYLNAISLLPDRYKSVLESISENIGAKVKEIRFRNGEPITLNTQNDIYYIRNNGVLTVAFSSDLLCVNEKDLEEIVFHLSRRSLHTYQDMIAKGFIPLRGGCKAGVVGRAVMKNGSVYSVSSFNSVNIRVARSFYGCSKDLIEKVGEDCASFLIIGAPLSGKTTVLRDLCRFYSGKDRLNPFKTAIVDERDEIASRSFGDGIDVGIHTDILTLYPKAIGTEIAVRTLSPDIVVLDEIGSDEEARAMLSAVNTGVNFIATAHGSSMEEVLRRPNIKRLVNAGAFKKAVVLYGKDNPCKVKEMVVF
jgi:stage III sporulation protein AA